MAGMMERVGRDRFQRRSVLAGVLLAASLVQILSAGAAHAVVTLRWREVVPLDRPSARSGQSMVYDPDLKGIVMFGGFDQSTEGDSDPAAGDMWLWDGSNWRKLGSAPGLGYM